MISTIAGYYWLIVIKLCRALNYIGANNLAEKLADLTGLKARLIELIDGYSSHQATPAAGTPSP